MAKDTRMTYDTNPSPLPNKQNGRGRRNAERQISYEETDNCVNEINESSFPFSNKAHRFIRQVSGSFNDRTSKLALIFSVIFNLIFAILFGIFFGIWMSQNGDCSSSSSSSSSSSPLSSPKTSESAGGSTLVNVPGTNYVTMEFCFLCTDIDDELRSRVMVKSKNNFCCTNDKIPDLEGARFLYLTAEYCKRKAASNELLPPQPCRPGSGPSGGGTVYPRDTSQVAAAHMMLDVQQTKLNVKGHGDSHENPLVWISRDTLSGRSFVGEGFHYSKGQLTIGQEGMYHVYSHVTLSTNENPLMDAEKIIVHSVTRKSRGHAVTLLFAQVTIKPNEVESMDIEGSFKFLEGDVLSVYISHPSFLKNTRSANVFGLFKL